MTTELQAAAEEMRIMNPSEDERVRLEQIAKLERELSIHKANDAVFTRRYYRNGERDREYCRDCLRNASFSAREAKRITELLTEIKNCDKV